jgi:t-SNARE complex subunit (syntaxin)
MTLNKINKNIFEISKNSNFHKLYKLKEDFLKYISENKIEKIYNHFDDFIRLLVGYKENSINKFHSFLVYYIRLDNNLKDYNTKLQFSKIFDKFWDIISIYNYRKSLDDYYEKNKLNKDDLNTKLLLDVNIKKKNLMNY